MSNNSLIIGKTMASLRIHGDAVDPDQISEQLGASPDLRYRKGERTKSGRIRHSGHWSIDAQPRTPGDLDAQITELFSRVSDDLDLWQDLGKLHRIDLFCGVFMSGSNQGISLAPATLLAAGTRGVEIGLDIYGPDDEPPDEST